MNALFWTLWKTPFRRFASLRTLRKTPFRRNADTKRQILTDVSDKCEDGASKPHHLSVQLQDPFFGQDEQD